MSVRSALERGARGIAAAWIVAGLSLLLVLALEGAYRAQAAWRKSFAPRPDQALIDAVGEPWFVDYLREDVAAETMRWTPHTYYRRAPFAGRHITVDTAGRRRTVHADAAPGTEVWMFGGSTLWGTYARDSMTIPSLLARGLAADGRPAFVVNHGEAGYVFTQELIALELALRERPAPRVVVFYHGINDLFATAQAGRAGAGQNEYRRRLDFESGQRLYGWRADLRSDLAATGTGLAAILGRMHTLKRLREAGAVAPPPLAATTLVAPAADVYLHHVRQVEALAGAYGFTPVYVWQPAPQGGRHVRSAHEESLARDAAASPTWQAVAELHAGVRPMVAAAMGPLVGDRFVDLSAAFDGTAGTVYLDVVGHVTERGNAIIADALRPRVTPLLAPRSGPVAPAGRPLSARRGP